MSPLQVQIDTHTRLAAPRLPLEADTTPIIATAVENAVVPPEAIRFVKITNPWPSDDVLFQPKELPFSISGHPAVVHGQDTWVAVQNNRAEPYKIQSGHQLGTLELVTTLQPSLLYFAEHLPKILEHLSQPQRRELEALLLEFRDVFATSKVDQGRTRTVEHEIKTEGGPVCLPYRRQNPIVRAE